MIVAADRLFPVSSPPLRDGALLVRRGAINSVGPVGELRRLFPGERLLSFPGAVIIPGLVNGHTHLEYSSFRRLARETDFLPWIRRLIELGSLRDRFWGASYWTKSAMEGARRSLSAGITTVGDVVTFGGGLDAGVRGGPRVRAFLEAVAVGEDRLPSALDRLNGFLDTRFRHPAVMRPGLSPHSIYTLPSSVLSGISDHARRRGLPLSVHLAESVHEKDLLEGKGPLASQIRRWGLPFGPGSDCSFSSYLRRAGLLREGTLLVHGVHLESADLRRAALQNTVLVTCPRSNLLLRCGLPRYRRWEEHGVRFVYGTDSLASVPSFDLFEEARAVRAVLPERGETILERLTLGGAEALGFDDITGSLEPGKAADYAVIRLEGAADCTEDDLIVRASARSVAATAVGGRVLYRAAGASASTVPEKGLSFPPSASSTAVTR